MLSVQQCLTQNGMTPVPHLPYSPDLAPSNFLLFPQMNKVLEGRGFADVEEVKQKIAEAQEGIKIEEFRNYFEEWGKSLDRYIASNGV